MKKFQIKKYFIYAIKHFYQYYLSGQSFIFKNAFDAILGTIVVLILPCISLGSTICTLLSRGDVNLSFINYFFPLLAICLAGVYDAYGKLERYSIKNFKLTTRIVLDCISMVSAFVTWLFRLEPIMWLSPMLLIACGALLSPEIVIRIRCWIKMFLANLFLFG